MFQCYVHFISNFKTAKISSNLKRKILSNSIISFLFLNAVFQGYMNLCAHEIYREIKEESTEPEAVTIPLVEADEHLPEFTPAMTDCKMLIAYEEKEGGLFAPTA